MNVNTLPKDVKNNGHATQSIVKLWAWQFTLVELK